MKLTLLGTGTPEPSLKRQSSGYIVEIGEDRLVLDCGPGSYHRFLEAGYKATDPTHVLFSHFHYDHFLEYPRIVLQHWDIGAGRIPDLAVFGPPPLEAITESLFGEKGAFSHDLRARTENPSSQFVFAERGGVLPRRRPAPLTREVAPGDVFSGRGWTARVGQAWHCQPQLQCLGYRIESERGTLCYSGDSGADCVSMIELAHKADVLVHMMQLESSPALPEHIRRCNATHLDVAEIARKADVATLVLTHIGAAIDTDARRERLLREMAGVFSGRIIWGEDLMTLKIGR